jgi:hypothetical protein
MPGSTFQTNTYDLDDLLKDCHTGVIQLPEFQRGWVWDEDRIKSLIASISQAFPVGALMSLDTGGPVKFKLRPIEGTPEKARLATPQSLLLDGQQRMTSLYQATLQGRAVEIVAPKKNKKPVRRWFYIDIRKSLDSSVDREEAIIGVPEDKIVRPDFGHEGRDLSSAQLEYQSLMFPLSQVFDSMNWFIGFLKYWESDNSVRDEFIDFQKKVLENFKHYKVPVIKLDRDTSKQAVCVVFEKVNQGGKTLDAFELVTAMYAADGHELRKDWYGADGEIGRRNRLKEYLRPGGAGAGILAEVSSTDFLQAISLFHTREIRLAEVAKGKQGKDLPAITGNRNALLNLPLHAYLDYQDKVEKGFEKTAKFLTNLCIYRTFDLPYQSQVVPLAAILADIGDVWEHDANKAKLVKWYWNGVFGELYSSASDTRIARDFMEVPGWLKGGDEPSTVRDATFHAERLKTMRMRLSAAYKGVNALLMKEKAKDFRSGQEFDLAVFFGEHTDIHHIFPQQWCKDHDKTPSVFDSIINKTPLSFRTNRILGGCAPSEYIAKLEKGDTTTPPIDPAHLDAYIASHLIDPSFLRTDAFDAFMADRQKRLLALIEKATGKAVYSGNIQEEGEDAESDDDTAEAEHTITSA